MKTELIDLSPTRKEIKIEVEPEVVREAFDRISDRFAKQVNVPGFRRGRAPRSVVRSRYKTEIRGEVLRELVPDAITNAIEKHELTAIGEPDIHMNPEETLDRIGDESISFHVNVEVLPSIELGQYKGVEAVRRVRPVTDQDVDRMIEGLRESSASLQPVEDRPAELGDIVTVNFIGKFVDHPDKEDIKVEDVEVILGGPNVQPEFTQNLAGVRVDDEKTFTVDYPEDFSTQSLAGNKVEYTGKVTAIRIKELPDVDDEWARSLGDEFGSVSTLRAKIQEDLEKGAAAEADNRLRNEILRKLLASHEFEAPLSLVEQQTRFRMESVVREMMGRGIDPRNQQLNWQSAHEELKIQAEEDVRSSMLLERIAEAEQISVSNEEIETEIEAVAAASRQPKEQVRSILTKDGGERSIAHRLRNRKALDLLRENANVTEGEWEQEKDEGEEKGGRMKAEG
ncbi:MAG TPA: trigger factor [Pyrinomonadaceae bacterium]|nr:trigger factor [Pyrinomonadaceae bacterium]